MQLHADDGCARDPGGSPFACESGCARPRDRRAVGARPTRQRALAGFEPGPYGSCSLALRAAVWPGRDAGGSRVKAPLDRAAEGVPGGPSDAGSSASGLAQLVGPGIVPMPSIAFVNSMA
jgi:hypothetical protein